MPSYVIVGASRGLGYEWLRQLSSNPDNIVIGVARNVAPVEAKLKADDIKNVSLLQADMADHHALATAAAEAAKITSGSLDYLIVNGVYYPSTTPTPPTGFTGREDLLRDDMIASINVNIIGVMFTVNAFLPLIRNGSVKKIIVMSTGLADLDAALKFGLPTSVIYSTTKAALNMVVIKYAVELKNDGIIVLALSPGLVNTSEKPPTEKELQDFQVMLKAMQQAYPQFEGPISPTESVTHQRRVIERITLEQSGEFLSHWGNKNWL